MSKHSSQRFDNIGYETIKQEKEASLLALKLFRATYDDIISYWVARSNTPEKIIPDALLADLRFLAKGLFQIRKHNGDILSIINVNRTPIGKTTGADLVYHDNAYCSHIMVQYSRVN